MIDFTTVQVLPISATIGAMKKINEELLADQLFYQRLAVAAVATGVLVLLVTIYNNQTQHERNANTI